MGALAGNHAVAFVGGPLDGTRRFVMDPLRIYVAYTESAPPPVNAREVERTAPATATPVFYCLTLYVTSDGRHRWFYWLNEGAEER